MTHPDDKNDKNDAQSRRREESCFYDEEKCPFCKARSTSEKEEEDDDDDDKEEEEEEEDEECLRTKPPRAWTTRRERNGTNPNTPQKLYNAWKTRRNRKRLILV
jgi:hypothetical protein